VALLPWGAGIHLESDATFESTLRIQRFLELLGLRGPDPERRPSLGSAIPTRHRQPCADQIGQEGRQAEQIHQAPGRSGRGPGGRPRPEVRSVS
jgi:hypothetical protein